MSTIDLYNESAYDMMRANTSFLIVAPRSYSASVAVPCVNVNHRGVFVHTNITQLPGSGSTTWATKIKAWDQFQGGASGTLLTIAAAAPRSASGIATLICYPGVSETSGALTRINSPLPRNFYVVASLSTGAANAGSSIFGISLQFVL